MGKVLSLEDLDELVLILSAGRTNILPERLGLVQTLDLCLLDWDTLHLSLGQGRGPDAALHRRVSSFLWEEPSHRLFFLPSGCCRSFDWQLDEHDVGVCRWYLGLWMRVLAFDGGSFCVDWGLGAELVVHVGLDVDFDYAHAVSLPSKGQATSSTHDCL